MDDYESFLATKSRQHAFDSIDLHKPLAPHLFGFQRALTQWALRKGRAAIFADTGLGKTLMQVEWARHVSALGRVLILAPLAVSTQTAREAARFGVEVRYLREDDPAVKIAITNYEMLDRFDPARFVGIILDESSILKAYDGSTRNAIIGAFEATPYRLACTATPAPNDFTELGNHAEFLGIQTRAEMLSEYFVHDGGKTSDWRIKGHAVQSFWRFVASWGAVVRSPADLGFTEEARRFLLPPIRIRHEVMAASMADARAAGFLFPQEARTLSDQRAVRRSTIQQRAKIAAKIAVGDKPALVWCELNDESSACAKAIKDSIEVRGSDSREAKEAALIGFCEQRPGHRVLVTKPSIAGFGLNLQHCANVIFCGPSHSYEQTYQAIRRCWRYGQKSPVDVRIIASECEAAVVENYRRKEADAARMADEMSLLMRDAVLAEVIGKSTRDWVAYNAASGMHIPEWLVEEVMT